MDSNPCALPLKRCSLTEVKYAIDCTTDGAGNGSCPGGVYMCMPS